ncbi:hypothetical protein HNY73_010367 [Argiope bruennichi]|uniref:Uncharacterized protein n=1 Tax=Argiope bruennichi TaxID=94029 RepID=A0A8T0F6S2_ARGBR|nr:hypothetical protein HNY73_010367 [Argiope bruennichi]
MDLPKRVLDLLIPGPEVKIEFIRDESREIDEDETLSQKCDQEMLDIEEERNEIECLNRRRRRQNTLWCPQREALLPTISDGEFLIGKFAGVDEVWGLSRNSLVGGGSSSRGGAEMHLALVWEVCRGWNFCSLEGINRPDIDRMGMHRLCNIGHAMTSVPETGFIGWEGIKIRFFGGRTLLGLLVLIVCYSAQVLFFPPEHELWTWISIHNTYEFIRTQSSLDFLKASSFNMVCEERISKENFTEISFEIAYIPAPEQQSITFKQFVHLRKFVWTST